MIGKCAGIGVIKEIDKQGRIVIPKEMRERYSLGESVEILMTEDGVLIRNPEYALVKRRRTNGKSAKDKAKG